MMLKIFVGRNFEIDFTLPATAESLDLTDQNRKAIYNYTSKRLCGKLVICFNFCVIQRLEFE